MRHSRRVQTVAEDTSVRGPRRFVTLLVKSADLLKRRQSAINSTARLVFSSSRYDHITPLLRQLHLLKARERIDFKLALLICTCQHGAAPSYLVDELSQPADFEARCRLRSASSSSLIVRRIRGCQLSATEPFRSPQLEFGTVCRSMSRMHHHCLFSAAV